MCIKIQPVSDSMCGVLFSFLQVDYQLPKASTLSYLPFSHPSHICRAQKVFVKKKKKIETKKRTQKRDYQTKSLNENSLKCSRTLDVNITELSPGRDSLWGGFLPMEPGTVSQATRASGPSLGSAGLGLWDCFRVKSLLLLWVMKAENFLCVWEVSAPASHQFPTSQS